MVDPFARRSGLAEALRGDSPAPDLDRLRIDRGIAAANPFLPR